MKRKFLQIITVILLFIVATFSCKKDDSVNCVILPEEVVVAVGGTATLTVTFIPENATNKKVSWESSDPRIATVDNGIVIGVAVGQATISVISQDGGRKATCLVAVIQPIVPEMIKVEGGSFIMGCTNEQGEDCETNETPSHTVTVSGFYMGKYEVTQDEWETVMGKNPSHFKGSNFPVESVSWNNIQLFIKYLNAATGKKYRLPTEAEWEFAARGGKLSKGYKYSGSNSADLVAWYTENSNNSTHPVGAKEPNELGLYDMSGNVWEFCSDWYGKYSNASQIDPIGPEIGNERVARGGSWSNTAFSSRVSNRGPWSPENIIFNGGFRLVLPAE